MCRAVNSQSTYIASPYSSSGETVIALAGTFRGEIRSIFSREFSVANSRQTSLFPLDLNPSTGRICRRAPSRTAQAVRFPGRERLSVTVHATHPICSLEHPTPSQVLSIMNARYPRLALLRSSARSQTFSIRSVPPISKSLSPGGRRSCMRCGLGPLGLG
jgi:hypothetical protein